MNGKPHTNVIAFGILTYAVSLTLIVFVLGRLSPTTATAVVLCVTNTISTLLGIGGGLLGQQVLNGRADPSTLPPGTFTKDTQTVQTPPVTLPPPSEPASESVTGG